MYALLALNGLSESDISQYAIYLLAQDMILTLKIHVISTIIIIVYQTSLPLKMYFC